MDLCQGDGVIVRFHSLRPPSQENVIQACDVKCHKLHVLIKKLAQSSLWQLIPEATPTTAEQVGRSAPTSTSTQNQEEQKMLMMNGRLQTITLINKSVGRYVNSAFWTACWAHLLCAKQSFGEWQMATPFHAASWHVAMAATSQWGSARFQ